MIVLHAGLLDGTLLFWVEPLTALPEETGDALAPLTKYSTRREAYIWLPVAGERPLASNAILEAGSAERELANPPKGRGQKATKLACWPVACLRPSWDDAIGFLCTCMDTTVLAPGILIGTDLRFLASALRFAGLLVHRKAYLPGLVNRNGGYRAVWEPVIEGDDGKTFAKLAARMPASVRALAMQRGEGPLAPPPQLVLTELLGAAVDALVRSASRPVSAPSRWAPYPRGPADFDSLHDQWMHALTAADPVLKAEPAELERLRAQVDAWRRPLTLAVRSAYRLVFRLEEPENAGGDGPGGRWYVRYLVQPLADESLLIPFRDALSARREGHP